MLTVCAAHGAVYGQGNAKPAIPRDAALEAKVEKTLAKMTLDEKIGQMLELNLDVMGNMKVENAKIDREKVRSVMQQYGASDADVKKMLKMTDAEILEKMGNQPVDIYQGETKRSWQLNEVMLDTLISKWKVGSILNAPGTRAPSIEQWQKWITLIQEKSMKYIGIVVHCSHSLSTWGLRLIRIWLSTGLRLLPMRVVQPTVPGCITL